MDEGFINSDGYAVHYRRYGAGHPIILVHGWGSDGDSNWLIPGWVEVLLAHRSVITMDVRGHGRSDKPHALAPYSYRNMSRDVLAVLDALAIQRADFMGYSMGAFMGAYLLGHHADRFTSMVLGGIGDETAASAVQGLLIGKALRASSPHEIEAGYAKQVRQYVAANEYSDLVALAYSAEKMWPEGYPLEIAGAGIGEATLPVLIVNGMNDQPYVATVGGLVAAIQNVEYFEIPDTDHLTVVAHDAFKKVVVEFLTEL